MADTLAELILLDALSWRRWLSDHHDEEAGVWLVLAKKGTIEPTRLTYDEALEEALCHGWIDGLLRRRDEGTYRQRFTPRRARSPWSQRNVAIAERLLAERRMHPAGRAAIAGAKRDGRWQAAYPGQASIEVPPDLAAALAAEPQAEAMFRTLTSQNRYAVLYRLHNTRRPQTRARQIERFVTMLARGETVHPQERGSKL
ncbi:MAG TPA: YdeI/OmpD-associated family protein [Solirubrobacteraceae bacterium]|nr:YdeI/OmpD-associated family protein [Solirubrobacteraceae bacterium]